MPKRFQVNQHILAYEFIAARDGEYCLICGRKPPRVKLEIDHADTNVNNWSPDNLHLLCKHHNLRLRQVTIREHRKIIRTYAKLNRKERESSRGTITTHMMKKLLDYRSGSAEMKANSYFEIRYREWLMETIKDNGFIVKKEAINSGAEMVGCSPMTTSRYLAKMTGAVGMLKETRDELGTTIIVPKKPL